MAKSKAEAEAIAVAKSQKTTAPCGCIMSQYDWQNGTPCAHEAMNMDMSAYPKSRRK